MPRQTLAALLALLLCLGVHDTSEARLVMRTRLRGDGGQVKHESGSTINVQGSNSRSELLASVIGATRYTVTSTNLLAIYNVQASILDQLPGAVDIVFLSTHATPATVRLVSGQNEQRTAKEEKAKCYHLPVTTDPVGSRHRARFACRAKFRGLTEGREYRYDVTTPSAQVSDPSLTFQIPIGHTLTRATIDPNKQAEGSDLTPQQIHIAYGNADDEMTVVWATGANATSTVTYACTGLTTRNVSATTYHFQGQGSAKGVQWYHNATLTGLPSAAQCTYVLSTGGVASPSYRFVAKDTSPDFVARLLVYGDMGRTGGAQSLKALIKEAESGKNTAVIHNGDFAYDLNSNDGINGDQFMNRIQPISTTLPYMTSVGNHVMVVMLTYSAAPFYSSSNICVIEQAYNFSNYKNRFRMPGNSENLYFSWNLGKAHFIAYSSEVYFTNFTADAIQKQYAWLQQDLQQANANRDKQPWIIAYGHRPMYCSNNDGDDCTKVDSLMRLGLEKLFYEQGVDIIFEAHEHSYERLWPVYNYTVTAKNYDNPAAPVHIISGAAGCNEDKGWCINPIFYPRGPWSAARTWLPGFYGYGHLVVHNHTHVYWDQVLADFFDYPSDRAWIVQDKHGPRTGLQ